MKEYIIDSNKFCGYIKTDDSGILVETMPIVKIFVGQPLENLTDWVLKKFGYCSLKEIK
jgi:hypothetical protein